ncbi:ABC transporter ATP-binding protein [Nonomuraea sp. NPDC050478]|uniref:ABC transporter ATP-binding protein n=1 Tax=Nonomuraea sp. NPDC050478 TaxID=3364365 RepID=UPI0037880FC1
MTQTGDRTVAEPILEAADLEVGYGHLPVLKGLSVAVRPGEIVALLGANGAGKTTTLMALSGVLTPISGSVRLDGRPAPEGLHRRADAGVALICEDRSVFMGLTCRENLRLGRGGVQESLALMPELEPLLDRKVGLMSGGEQQMLTLARALAGSPKVLLADELTLGLAPLIVARLLTSLRAAADRGVGVLIVEERVQRALQIADRVCVLRRGEIVIEGTAAEMGSRLAEIEASYLSAAADEPGATIGGHGS